MKRRMSIILTTLSLIIGLAIGSQAYAQNSVDLTLRRGAEAHFASRDACDLTFVDINVTEQKDKTIPGQTTTMLRTANITLQKTPLSIASGCGGVFVNARDTVTNPAFTLDPLLSRARLTGSTILIDAANGGTAIPVTFDISWMGAGPLGPSFHFERQDLGDSIALVLFFGVQRPAIAGGSVVSGGRNQIPNAAFTTDTRMFKDLNATATIQKK